MSRLDRMTVHVPCLIRGVDTEIQVCGSYSPGMSRGQSVAIVNIVNITKLDTGFSILDTGYEPVVSLSSLLSLHFSTSEPLTFLASAV